MLSAEKVPELRAIKKVNIGAQVYEQMKAQILSGVWTANEKIPSENQLMEIFGVSRTTVRQAIQKLVAIGYLETRRGDGSYVNAMGLEQYFRGMIPASCLKEEDLREIVSFRRMFECGVAEKAAQYATKEQIQRLRKNFAEMLNTTENLEKYVKIDFEFHKILGECTHNALVMEIYKIIGEILLVTMGKITGSIGCSHGVKCHRLILDAIEKGNTEAAREAMRYHVDKNVEMYYDCIDMEANVISIEK